ncbi:hypothetical protein PAXRUDRAFT_556615 [Paxillus rubicundulus Ve08.2h10]|uniref:Unplaced genomic scaffold scaffold_426, whole genome shotgun sequence n=1 Tax=Paxillus rubicundulus Ve08.2h10 TaxID=930991 RepID=A0A0D0E5H0_9AGAM|nr:hypothetical protein PAXRUDRAFT_556615 [Paxillus rubicundulus Ve08.2h10]
MSSIAEIIHFTASEGYKSGSASLPLSRMSKLAGLNKSYIGYQTEDPTVLFWVIDWDSKEAHEAFTKLDGYPDMVDACRPVMASRPTANLVQFEDAKGALEAPITEFVTFTLHEGKTMTDLEPLVKELHQKLAGAPKFHGDSWAVVIDKPNVYHGILGWDTVEAHWDAVKDGPRKEVIDRIKQVADLWLVHAALKPFSE